MNKNIADGVPNSALQPSASSLPRKNALRWRDTPTMTVDFAARHHARFILRGIRSVKDYEYELNIADLNRRLAGVETVFLFSEPEWACISSSVVKELMHFGKDITPYLPEGLEYE